MEGEKKSAEKSHACFNNQERASSSFFFAVKRISDNDIAALLCMSNMQYTRKH